jgi:uncharacterized protein YndB with AHSA1/START domain
VPGDLGSLEKIDRRWQLRFTRRLPHPPEKVWRALTEPEHLEAWFPTTIDGERKAGAPLHFAFRDGEGQAEDGEMIAYEPPKVLEFRWRDETLRFELRPDGATGDRTVLTFLNTFDELGKAARDAAGWHACLDLLVHDLAREAPPWKAEDRWGEVHPAYVDLFGPEAATQGPPERPAGQP